MTHYVVDYTTVCKARTRTRQRLEAANARLIAAAPDLLELLKVYVHIEETSAPYSSSPLREKACAAIARAEGSAA